MLNSAKKNQKFFKQKRLMLKMNFKPKTKNINQPQQHNSNLLQLKNLLKRTNFLPLSKTNVVQQSKKSTTIYKFRKLCEIKT